MRESLFVIPLHRYLDTKIRFRIVWKTLTSDTLYATRSTANCPSYEYTRPIWVYDWTVYNAVI